MGHRQTSASLHSLSRGGQLSNSIAIAAEIVRWVSVIPTAVVAVNMSGPITTDVAVSTRVIDLKATRVNLVATMMAVISSMVPVLINVVAVLVNAVDTPTIVSG